MTPKEIKEYPYPLNFYRFVYDDVSFRGLPAGVLTEADLPPNPMMAVERVLAYIEYRLIPEERCSSVFKSVPHWSSIVRRIFEFKASQTGMAVKYMVRPQKVQNLLQVLRRTIHRTKALDYMLTNGADAYERLMYKRAKDANLEGCRKLMFDDPIPHMYLTESTREKSSFTFSTNTDYSVIPLNSFKYCSQLYQQLMPRAIAESEKVRDYNPLGYYMTVDDILLCPPSYFKNCHHWKSPYDYTECCINELSLLGIQVDSSTDTWIIREEGPLVVARKTPADSAHGYLDGVLLVNEYGMTPRTLTALSKADITTVGDLLTVKPAHFINIPGIGTGAYVMITKVLERYHYTQSSDGESWEFFNRKPEITEDSNNDDRDA